MSGLEETLAALTAADTALSDRVTTLEEAPGGGASALGGLSDVADDVTHGPACSHR